MIKNNESSVLITNRNIKYYKDRGYECQIGYEITINVTTMPLKSHNKVIAICEICKSENEIHFSKYNKNKDNGGFYACKKCSSKKRKATCLIKYGVEYAIQRDSERKRMEVWMSSTDFKNASKETQLSKYGMLYTQTEESRNNISTKTKAKVKEKKELGIYDCALSRPGMYELSKKGMFDKYGQEYAFNVDEIKQKRNDSNLDKFGHISPFGNKDIQNKVKATMTYKYGEDNPFKVKYIQDKIQLILKERYYDVENAGKKEFVLYRNKIRHLTSKIKKTLFDNWDGCDYYDGEYIFNNTSLYCNDNNYPTVDHKISCLYGFLNNISIEEIADISNLCITKKIINTKKRHLCESEFIDILKALK